jgi:hypothetical protein
MSEIEPNKGKEIMSYLLKFIDYFCNYLATVNENKMKSINLKILLYLIPLFFFTLSCSKERQDSFYQGFVDPPAEARPFVRWWWNGNHIEADEIKRELDIMKKAGIGGIEINPIAMPEYAKKIGTQPVPWLSKEWNQLLALTCQEAHKRDMIADMIVGSGWPFGGEFLKPEEITQRVMVNRIPVNGPSILNLSYSNLLDKMNEEHYIEQAESNEVFFISLVPVNASDETEAIDLMEFYQNNTLRYSVGKGQYNLIYGVLQKGHRKITQGTLGASGNAMDHYSKQVTQDYLLRLKKISEDTGIPLKDLLRALFCDSIELAGANWTDQLLNIFSDTYGYELKPYMPFVFYKTDKDSAYWENEYKFQFRDELRRVRYDYNRLLVDVFLNNFTRTFKDFCAENELQCRYQAYGTPFLMGMLEGYMIPDIPEANNWLYSWQFPPIKPTKMNDPRWKWRKRHGYMIWNLYAAAGGHLNGRRIISCESMTNTRGVYKTSLEMIKQHDDMNFISGITHSVLHGYSYSPPEAGFPGWIKYGTFFSPQNTWWPYFNLWADYNSRLSYVFQNSQPAKTIALLGPTGDIWSNIGLNRTYFHMHPWYLHELWEPISQNGSSCEYLNEKIIQEAEKKDGKLIYGPMDYETLWLCGIESMQPATAQAIKKYVETGGQIMLIDSIPHRSLSLIDADSNDFVISSVFDKLKKEYPQQVKIISRPNDQDNLIEWVSEIIDQMDISRNVKISVPDPGLYQIYQQKEERDIYFFTNTWRNKKLEFTAEFPVENKVPWIWDPETGIRNVYPFTGVTNVLNITLKPLQSLLLVFEPNLEKQTTHTRVVENQNDYQKLEKPWKLTFKHANGKEFKRTFQNLKEFTSTSDSVLHSFAGKVIYETILDAEDNYSILRLNDVNDGVTEVYVNGKKVGVRWYGEHTYDLEDYLKQGENSLKVVYTAILANYCTHLKDNPAAQRYTNAFWDKDGYSLVPVGIEGPVRLHAKKKE